MKFKRLISEPCIHIKQDNNGKIVCILLVYVDDILIAGNKEDIKLNKNLIKSVFNIKDAGNVDWLSE